MPRSIRSPEATCSTSAGTGSEVKTISLCSPTCSRIGQTAPFAGTARPRRGSDRGRQGRAGVLQIGRHALPIMRGDKSYAHLPSAGRKTAVAGSFAARRARAQG